MTVADRPPMDETLMEVARVMARRSTCTRNSVGVVIALETRILTSGYNGAPSGLPHCDHTCDCELGVETDLKCHTADCPAQRPCETAVHAEANAIAFAARNGIALLGSTLYTTLEPCLKCAQLIINAGIWSVCAARRYRSSEGVDLLRSVGVTTRLVR